MKSFIEANKAAAIKLLSISFLLWGVYAVFFCQGISYPTGMPWLEPIKEVIHLSPGFDNKHLVTSFIGAAALMLVSWILYCTLLWLSLRGLSRDGKKLSSRLAVQSVVIVTLLFVVRLTSSTSFRFPVGGARLMCIALFLVLCSLGALVWLFKRADGSVTSEKRERCYAVGAYLAGVAIIMLSPLLPPVDALRIYEPTFWYDILTPPALNQFIIEMTSSPFVTLFGLASILLGALVLRKMLQPRQEQQSQVAIKPAHKIKTLLDANKTDTIRIISILFLLWGAYLYLFHQGASNPTGIPWLDAVQLILFIFPDIDSFYLAFSPVASAALMLVSLAIYSTLLWLSLRGLSSRGKKHHNRLAIQAVIISTLLFVTRISSHTYFRNPSAEVMRVCICAFLVLCSLGVLAWLFRRADAGVTGEKKNRRYALVAYLVCAVIVMVAPLLQPMDALRNNVNPFNVGSDFISMMTFSPFATLFGLASILFGAVVLRKLLQPRQGRQN